MPHQLHTTIHKQQPEQGVVLVISLVILVVISLLSAASLRSVSTTEITAGNVRKTEVATQAAEFALRWCQDEVLKFKNSDADGDDATANDGDGDGDATTLANNNFSDLQLWDAVDPQTKALTNWDGAGTGGKVILLSADMLNQTNLKYATYKRMPECMVVPVDNAAPAVATRFMIVARGFGPEVSAVDANRTRPNGSEAWMQSTITVQ